MSSNDKTIAARVPKAFVQEFLDDNKRGLGSNWRLSDAKHATTVKACLVSKIYRDLSKHHVIVFWCYLALRATSVLSSHFINELFLNYLFCFIQLYLL